VHRQTAEAASTALDSFRSRPIRILSECHDEHLEESHLRATQHHGSNCEAALYLLRRDKDTIERELGAKLNWRELPETKERYVVLNRPNSDPAERTNWPEQHAWLQEKLERFAAVFGPRIKLLNADDYVPEPTSP